jgi:hypothetical protein
MLRLVTVTIGVLVLLAALAAASCSGDDSQQATATPTPTGSDALPILKGVGAGLPLYPGLTVYEEYIYTAADSTDSVNLSQDPTNYVIHFYWEHLPPAGWDLGASEPTLSTEPTSIKDTAVHQTGTLIATRGGFKVTVTVVDNIQKDPARGTTRVDVAIERTDPNATVPPIPPSPTPVESGI